MTTDDGRGAALVAPSTRAAELWDFLCETMHDAYELAAAGAGWETNPRSAVPWRNVPEANQTATRAAVVAVIGAYEIARLTARADAQRAASE